MNTLGTESRGASFLKFDPRKLVFYFISLAFIVIVYLKWGEVHELREIFLKSNVSWLLVAVFFQIFTYYFFALNYHYVFKIKGHEIPTGSLLPLALITQFLNQAFPSAGVSGQIFLVDYLRQRGATVVEGISRAILEIVSMFCGFGVIFIIASVIFFTGGAFQQHPNLIYLIYVFLFFTTIALWIFFAIQRSNEPNHGDGYLKRLLGYFKNSSGESVSDAANAKNSGIKNYWRIFLGQLKDSMDMKSLRENKTLFPFAVYSQLAIFVLDILTLYVLTFALDIKLSFGLIWITFTFTQFISMLSFIPGSLLIYEGGMALMLIAFGVERGSALTLALLFRALIFWLSMPIGWLLYRQYERENQKTEFV